MTPTDEALVAARDAIRSIHWHASHHTVNVSVFVNNANIALKALDLLSQPPSGGWDDAELQSPGRLEHPTAETSGQSVTTPQDGPALEVRPSALPGWDDAAVERLNRARELLAKASHSHAGKPSARAKLFALLLPKDRESEGLLPTLLAGSHGSALSLLRELDAMEAGNADDVLGGCAGKKVADFKRRYRAALNAAAPRESLSVEKEDE